MRAGFETYRAFTQDAKDLSAAVKSRGKLDLPVLLLAGEASTFISVSSAYDRADTSLMAVCGSHDQRICQQCRIRQDPP
jgi:hypothetical protein